MHRVRERGVVDSRHFVKRLEANVGLQGSWSTSTGMPKRTRGLVRIKWLITRQTCPVQESLFLVVSQRNEFGTTETIETQQSMDQVRAGSPRGNDLRVLLVTTAGTLRNGTRTRGGRG